MIATAPQGRNRTGLSAGFPSDCVSAGGGRKGRDMADGAVPVILWQEGQPARRAGVRKPVRRRPRRVELADDSLRPIPPTVWLPRVAPCSGGAISRTPGNCSRPWPGRADRRPGQSWRHAGRSLHLHRQAQAQRAHLACSSFPSTPTTPSPAPAPPTSGPPASKPRAGEGRWFLRELQGPHRRPRMAQERRARRRPGERIHPTWRVFAAARRILSTSSPRLPLPPPRLPRHRRHRQRRPGGLWRGGGRAGGGHRPGRPGAGLRPRQPGAPGAGGPGRGGRSRPFSPGRAPLVV